MPGIELVSAAMGGGGGGVGGVGATGAARKPGVPAPDPVVPAAEAPSVSV